jgi:hypothetical protein
MRVILIFLLLVGCTRLKTVSTKELDLRNLSGEWHSDNSSLLNIYCTGAMSFEINTYYFPFFWEPWKHTSSGDYISEVHEDHFRVEPFGRKFKVDKWPYQDGKRVLMVLDGRTWVRNEVQKCTPTSGP